MKEKEYVENLRKKKMKYQNGESLIVTILTLCAVLGGFLWGNLNFKDSDVEFSQSGDDQEIVQSDLVNEEIKLPTFKDKDEILEKVKKENENGNIWFGNWGVDGDFVIMEDAMEAVNSTVSKDFATGSAPSSSLESAETSNYSTTNVQVQDVDEAEIVKTNGEYIYYLSRGNLYIFDLKPTTKLVKTISISSTTNFYYEHEMYIDGNYITVIAQDYLVREELKTEDTKKTENVEKKSVVSSLEIDMAISNSVMPIYGSNATSIYVYDIDSYELVKKVTLEGDYLSSRKIDDNVYVVTNKYLNCYTINENNVLPIYKEEYALKGGNPVDLPESTLDYQEIPANEIQYFHDIEDECSYMMITSLDLNDIDKEAKIETYLGASNEIYCSKENLFVTKVDYQKDGVTTKIHKFNLDNGEVKYVATGSVGGQLLNQYSMDEYNDNFRITTTKNDGNNLYVLNEKLEVIGRLENLAEGEKIYATRFMGEKCYLVTYKTVDPLFVIDLSSPENPTVLGELKIPGYSTYLHPLGENYLIGFGEDSVEKSYLNWQGEQEVIAYNVGMKLAIFDVSDLNNPKEIHSIKIGGRGSSSELLNNPKVLYYDQEEGIFAFPAILTEETKFYEDGTPMYGDVVFKGALVYNLDVEDGIELRGQIEHETDNKNKYGDNIERILRVDDNFYTLAPNGLKVTNVETMQELEDQACKIESK